jgi:hypothetical protein
LEDVGLGDVGAEKRLVAGDAEFVDVRAETEDDLLGVELFAGVVGRAVLGAAAAFDAGKGLEGGEACNVL